MRDQPAAVRYRARRRNEPERNATARARIARGAAAAVFATFVAFFFHMAGGGVMPPLAGIAVPLFFSVIACVALAGLRQSLPRVAASVGLSQVLFHWIFTAAAKAQATATAPQAGAANPFSGSNPAAATALDPHAHHSLVPASFAESLAGQTGAAQAGAMQAAHAGHSSLLMVLAHLLAGVLTVAVLHRAEAVLSGLASLLRMLEAAFLPRTVRSRPVPVSTLRRSGTPRTPAPRVLVPLGVFRSCHLDRGPPALIG